MGGPSSLGASVTVDSSQYRLYPTGDPPRSYRRPAPQEIWKPLDAVFYANQLPMEGQERVDSGAPPGDAALALL